MARWGFYTVHDDAITLGQQHSRFRAILFCKSAGFIEVCPGQIQAACGKLVCSHNQCALRIGPAPRFSSIARRRFSFAASNSIAMSETLNSILCSSHPSQEKDAKLYEIALA